jgi:GT2 family glycosyltransferase
LIEKNSDRFRAIHHSVKSLPQARNVGIALSRGEIIVFVDDDVKILPGFLKGHAVGFSETGIWGVTGPALDPEASGLIAAHKLTQTDIDDLNVGHNVIRTDFPYDVVTLHGCNMSIRRAAFEKVGDFDEFYKNYGDDVEMSHRIKLAGGRLRYTPDARLIHYQRHTGGTRDNPINSAPYIRNYVRSVIFFDLHSRKNTTQQINVLGMFRRMILSRPAYLAGRTGVHQMVAFWRGVMEAKWELNRRKRQGQRDAHMRPTN